MKTKLASAAALAAAFALSGCSGMTISEKGRSYDLNDTGRKLSAAKDVLSAMMTAENNLGREAAANVVARFGLADDEKLQKYVRLVGATCARKAKRKDVTWRFAVLDEKAPNAFSAPGGYVFVTSGLVKMLNDEAQLAGVLAHEIEHVDNKHAMKALKLAGTAEAAAKLLDDKVAYRAGAKGLINLMDRGLGRSAEMDADSDGAKLIARVGYDSTGLTRALALMEEKAGDSAKKFESRHPPYDQRIAALNALNLEEKGAKLASRFRESVASR